MIEALRPWVGVAFGAWLTFLGVRWLAQPQDFVGTGIIPATVPRTIRFLGIVSIIIGIANVAVNFPQLFSE